MVNYQNGKIYKIEDVGGNMCYIGSTTKDFLSKRMVQHRTMYRHWKEHNTKIKYSVFSIFDLYEIDNCRIVLIELYPCDTKDQLTSREAFYIKQNNCVNRVIPGRTQKQYALDNKEYIKELQKDYYDDNKQQYKQYYNDNKEHICAKKAEK